MDKEDEEDVGARLDRIRSRQEMLCGQDSDGDDSSDAPMIHLHAQSQPQEESSQEEGPTSTQATIIGNAFHSAPVPGAPSQGDPHCPFAPGGYMEKRRPPLAQPQPTSRAPSQPTSRAPSQPTSRAPSPASTTTATKASKKKTPLEIAEEEKLQRDIDTVVSSFKPEYRDYIVCEDARDPKCHEDKEFYNVARWLKVSKPTPRRLDLALFNSKQIRKLAQNCGVKGGGNLTLFSARRKIATAINMGTVYNDNTIANPTTSADERKVNTLMRLINACFHSDMKDKFIDLNDVKKRKDYEAAHGGNPVKDFWIQVSEFTNDSSRNDELGVVLEARQGEDQHLQDFVESGELNLNDWTLQTYLSCQQNMNDCMKAREICLKMMRMSGHHSNDLWTYATNITLTKLRKASKPVPAKAVYYCHVLCSKNPDIDGKFASFLSEQLKSDSAVDLTGDAGLAPETAAAGKRKAIVAIDSLMQTLSTATTEMSKVFGKKRNTEDNTQDRGQWNEYFSISERFLELKDQPNKLPLLSNMSIRVKMLERSLGIPSEQSITNGIHPIEVVVTDTSNKDCSDVSTSNK
jgi:hypothetical protein